MSPRDIKPEDLMPKKEMNTDISNIHTEIPKEVQKQSVRMILPIIEYTSLFLLIIMVILIIYNKVKKDKVNKIMLAIAIVLFVIMIGAMFIRFTLQLNVLN